jgi:hypothetical protein
MAGDTTNFTGHGNIHRQNTRSPSLVFSSALLFRNEVRAVTATRSEISPLGRFKVAIKWTFVAACLVQMTVHVHRDF